MAKDADFLMKNTLIFMWMKVCCTTNDDDWCAVINGGAEFKESLDIEILARTRGQLHSYKIRHNGQTFVMTLRDVLALMDDLCKQRGFIRSDLISRSLNKYF